MKIGQALRALSILLLGLALGGCTTLATPTDSAPSPSPSPRPRPRSQPRSRRQRPVLTSGTTDPR